MRNFFRKISSKRGQAVVEYALLLMIATLTATAFFALDNNMKTKIQTISTDFETDVGLLPNPSPVEVGGCSQNEDCLELSPPVAKFQAPSPSYKGREVKMVDESYDVDGYVEHYIWSVDGEIIRMQKEQIADKGGLFYTFRNSGTYQVSLLVVDNDGLVSNLETKTITILNRNPTLNLTVENEEGISGSNVTVSQGCTATFYTSYADPDLPYDELTLLSIFTDQSGVTSRDNTAPNEFKRDFHNLGTNTYYVQITDEDGASASATVSVNVVPNATGACNDKDVIKPIYKIIVEGVYTQKGNVYTFKAGTKATVKPSVKWGSFPAHSIPYYWQATQGNTNGDWYTSANGSSLNYPYPNQVFTIGTDDIVVTGMARDTSALSNDDNPELKGMSNKDSVVLRVKLDGVKSTPTPIISLNGKKNRSDNEPVTIVDVSDVADKSFSAKVESILSEDERGFDIKGVRWKLPDGTWRPNANENGAREITDSTGKTQWFYLGKVNSPDTILNATKFTWKSGAKNEWKYELEVINELDILSDEPAEKTIKLTNNPNKPPVGVCSPNPSMTYAGQPLTLNAKGSKDPDGPTPVVRWSMNNGDSWSAWQSPTTNVPKNSSWIWNSARKFNVLLEVKDDDGKVVKVNCPVEILKPVPVDNFEFFPEFWYVEDRVQNAGQDIRIANRSTPMKEVYYSMFSAYGAKGGTYTGTLPDKTFAAGINPDRHSAPTTMETKTYAAMFMVSVHIADEDGTLLSGTCLDGVVIKKRINGKTVDTCTKYSHYFRMAAYTSNTGNLSGGTSKKCTYRSVHKDLKTYSQYVDRWDKGATDKTAYYDVGLNLRSKLQCK